MSREKNKIKIKYNDGGYTLIEIVIVLMITAVVFVSAYALFAKSMKYDTEGRYEIVASELAQEGVEMIKNKKEKNEMDWAVWDPEMSGINDVDDENNGLTTFKGIDSLSGCNPMLTWDGGYDFSCNSSAITIQYNKSSGEYAASCSGECVGPKFNRKCRKAMVDNDKALRVTCEVSWESQLLNGAPRSVEVSLVLTDWER